MLPVIHTVCYKSWLQTGTSNPFTFSHISCAGSCLTVCLCPAVPSRCCVSRHMLLFSGTKLHSTILGRACPLQLQLLLAGMNRVCCLLC